MTVLFSDIRGFTSLSAEMPPEAVVQMLNEYFSEMVDEVFRWNGVLDKFLGDGICAVFGPPFLGDEHARNAVCCALGMLTRLQSVERTPHEPRRAPAQDRHRPAYGAGHRRKRRLPIADGVYAYRRHREHREPHRGADEGPGRRTAHLQRHLPRRRWPGCAQRAPARTGEAARAAGAGRALAVDSVAGSASSHARG